MSKLLSNSRFNKSIRTTISALYSMLHISRPNVLSLQVSSSRNMQQVHLQCAFNLILDIKDSTTGHASLLPHSQAAQHTKWEETQCKAPSKNRIVILKYTNLAVGAYSDCWTSYQNCGWSSNSRGDIMLLFCVPIWYRMITWSTAVRRRLFRHGTQGPTNRLRNQRHATNGTIW